MGLMVLWTVFTSLLTAAELGLYLVWSALLTAVAVRQRMPITTFRGCLLAATLLCAVVVLMSAATLLHGVVAAVQRGIDGDLVMVLQACVAATDQVGLWLYGPVMVGTAALVVAWATASRPSSPTAVVSAPSCSPAPQWRATTTETTKTTYQPRPKRRGRRPETKQQRSNR